MEESVGARLLRFRKDLRLTQEKMAEKMRVTPSYLSRLETSEDMVPSDMFLALCAHEFGVSEHWLRTGEGSKYPPPIVPDGQALYQMAPIALAGDDRRLANILQDIKTFWDKATPEVRDWFKVHFYRTFPEVIEHEPKERKTSTSKDDTGIA